MWTDRTEKLVGAENVKRLENANVAIVGLGGVGGYVAVLLSRAGVGNFTLIDFDKVDETNLNRQVVATRKTIGKLKTEVLKEQLLEINPNCNITIKTEKLVEENISKLLDGKYDYVVDAIDIVTSKIALCVYAHRHNLNIISAMGAGNRIDIPEFKVMDIYKTSNDGLAKVMRKKLRENGVESHTVVCANTVAIKNIEGVGSISYYPCMSGCVLAAKVVGDLLK